MTIGARRIVIVHAMGTLNVALGVLRQIPPQQPQPLPQQPQQQPLPQQPQLLPIPQLLIPRRPAGEG